MEGRIDILVHGGLLFGQYRGATVKAIAAPLLLFHIIGGIITGASDQRRHSCQGGVCSRKFTLIYFFKIRKSRGKEDETQNRDDRKETWKEVLFYTHFHFPRPHSTLLCGSDT